MHSRWSFLFSSRGYSMPSLIQVLDLDFALSSFARRRQKTSTILIQRIPLYLTKFYFDKSDILADKYKLALVLGRCLFIILFAITHLVRMASKGTDLGTSLPAQRYNELKQTRMMRLFTKYYLPYHCISTYVLCIIIIMSPVTKKQ